PLGESDLATSYMTLDQLIRERGMPPGSLAELVAGTPMPGARSTGPRMAIPAEPAPDEADVVPVESLAPSEEAVSVSGIPYPVSDEEGAVPIECLLYSAEAARRRAMELRQQLASARGDDARFQSLLNE